MTQAATQKTIHEAAPHKLPSGDWGAKVFAAAAAKGDLIEVVARSGKKWLAVIDGVTSRRGETTFVTTRKPVAGEVPEAAKPQGFFPVNLGGKTWGAGTYAREIVSGGTEVTVTKRDGTSYQATIVGLEDRRQNGSGEILCYTIRRKRAGAAKPSTRERTRLVGKHTHEHCSCGNWSGAGSPCLYSYGEAKAEGEARFIQWERVPF